MGKIIKVLLPLLAVLLLCFAAGAVYYNGSLNGVPTPELLSATRSRQNGILLEWTSAEMPIKSENSGFAVYRSENGVDYIFIGSTFFSSYLDANSLEPGKEYTYKIASFADNYYGDGEYVFSDYSNELSAICQVSEKYENEFFSASEMSDYLAEQIMLFEQTVQIYYTGEWVSGLWEDVYSRALVTDERLKWHFFSYSGFSEYSGCVDGSNTYTLTYEFEFYSSAAEYSTLIGKMPDILKTLRNTYKLDDKSSDYKKAKALYCYLFDNVSFDSSKRSAGGKFRDRFSAYDALVNGRASSQGIALAFLRLAEEIGLNANVIHGDGYCWNLVGIGDEWYNIDVCEAIRADYLTYEYFLFPDSQCSYTRDGYYVIGSAFSLLHPSGSKEFVREGQPPEDIKITAASKEVTLSFSTPEDGVRIFVSSNGRDFSLLADAASGKYIHKNLKNGDTYYYKFASYRLDDEKEKLLSDYSPVYKATPSATVSSLNTPEITNIEQISGNTLKVEFSDVTGALSYEIYVIENNEEKRIGTSSGLFCLISPEKDSGAIAIRAINGSIKSKLSEKKDYSLLNETAEIFTISSADGSGITLEFTEDVSICVFRSESLNGEYKSIGFSDSGAYTDTAIEEGKLYYYRISAQDGIFCGVKSAPRYMMTLSTPTKISLSQTSEGIHLEWTAHPKANIYSIYRSESLEGEYVCIFTERQNLFYTDNSAEKGKMYFYKLSCSGYAGQNEYFESSFGQVSETLFLDKTDILSVVRNRTGDTVVFTWEEVQFADGYKISRSETLGGEKTELFCEGKTSYTDDEVSPGKSYYYSVTPYKKSASRKIYGAEGQVSISFRNLSATFTDSQSQTSLEWTNVMEADGYVLLRKVGDAAFTVFGIIDENSSLLDRASSNVDFQYKIYPYIDIGGRRIFGSEVYFSLNTETNAVPLDSSDSPATDEQAPSTQPTQEKDTDAIWNRLVNILIPLLAVLVVIAAVYYIFKHFILIKKKKK